MDKTAAWKNVTPQSSCAEGFKALRTNLVYSAEEQDCRMIALTTPQKDASSPRFVANLGAIMACEDRNVLLVDGDLRTGALTDLLMQEVPEFGLSNLMEDEKNAEEVVVPSGVPYLALLPCGKINPDPAALFSKKKAAQVMRALREKYDYIIVYTPNVKDYTDAVVLSKLVDGTVILFSAEKTQVTAAQKCKELLEAVDAPVLGAVLNYFH